MKRRDFLRGLGLSTLALPFYKAGMRSAHAFSGGENARRVIFFYFPDGVPGPSSDGEPSLWHPTGSQSSFQLPEVLSILEPYKDDCVFFRGLSMGSTDTGSHPGGAKKLLTGVDGGNGTSLDHHLANGVGADRPFRHLYLGAQANHNNASGDKHISYVGPGQTIAPEDNPVRAFNRLFGDVGGNASAKIASAFASGASSALSVIDTAKADLDDLRAKLGKVEKSKLDFHLEALREIENRVKGVGGGGGEGGGGGAGGATCEEPFLGADGINDSNLYNPELFPDTLRAQIDVMVQAMACDLTRVGVIQSSFHTSELIMSRFPGTDMYDPGFDMRSHQASHYGPRHDFAHREFADFVKQCKWWTQQFAYLLESLKQRPEGDGNMLDYSVVLLCTEVCDGNVHSHDDMPFVLAGGGGGRINTGRLLSFDYHRHSDLLVGIAQAMGDGVTQYGQASSGPLPGLLA